MFERVEVDMYTIYKPTTDNDPRHDSLIEHVHTYIETYKNPTAHTRHDTTRHHTIHSSID